MNPDKSIPFACLHCGQIIQVTPSDITIEIITNSEIITNGKIFHKATPIRLYRYRHCQYYDFFDQPGQMDSKDNLPKEVLTEDFKASIHVQKNREIRRGIQVMWE